MNLLEVRNLRKSYGALKVTDDLDLSVEEGELHAIIGPNGAGKSTLIAQLSGQATSDGGSVRFDGTEMMGRPMHRGHVAQLSDHLDPARIHSAGKRRVRGSGAIRQQLSFLLSGGR